MKFMKFRTVVVALVITLAATGAYAQNTGTGHEGMNHGTAPQASGHEGMDHGAMSHGTGEHGTEVMGVGVIHRVSKLNKMVNLTHEPIPALKWPEMTMDLPVADSVDLGSLKAGDKVKFHLKLGDDKKYVITSIMK